KGLKNLGFEQLNSHYFDTLKIKLSGVEVKADLKKEALRGGVNLNYFDDTSVGISIDETTRIEDIEVLLQIFASIAPEGLKDFNIKENAANLEINWPEEVVRKSDYLQHPVFNTHHSEHEMLRYLKRLENKDLSLVHSMISLGSCTMKLNATAEMIPVTWPEFGNMHPFAPVEQAAGYQQMFKELESWLSEITGFDATSLQPNSGAQGEYAGLM